MRIKRYIDITEEMRRELADWFDRSGVGVTAFAGLIRRDSPVRISSTMISSWLSGRAKTLNPRHYEVVISKLKQMASEPLDPDFPVGRRNIGRIPLTDAMKKVIAENRPAIYAAIRTRDDVPASLSPQQFPPAIIKNKQSIVEAHWQFIQKVLDIESP